MRKKEWCESEYPFPITYNYSIFRIIVIDKIILNYCGGKYFSRGKKKKKKEKDWRRDERIRWNDRTKSSVTEGFHFRLPLRVRFPMRVRKCDRVKAKVINPLIGSNAGEKFLLVARCKRPSRAFCNRKRLLTVVPLFEIE